MTTQTGSPAKVGWLRRKETMVSPEFVNVTAAQYTKLLLKEYSQTAAGLLAEAVISTVLIKQIIGDEIDPPFDWIVSGVVAVVLLAVALFTGFHAGEASRTSMPTALLWLLIPLGIGAALFTARLMHGQIGGAEAVDENGMTVDAGTTGSDNLVIALLLVAIFVATTALAFHAGRRLHNPALVGMVRADARREELAGLRRAESSALVAQKAQLAITDAEIEHLVESRNNQLREVYATFETAAAVARLRLAELLGDPKATENTRTVAALGQLPHGLRMRDSEPQDA